jgi:hypothetical protein
MSELSKPKNVPFKNMDDDECFSLAKLVQGQKNYKYESENIQGNS